MLESLFLALNKYLIICDADAKLVQSLKLIIKIVK